MSQYRPRQLLEPEAAKAVWLKSGLLNEQDIYRPLPENYVCERCNLEGKIGFNTGTVWSDEDPPVLVLCECFLRMYYTDEISEWDALSSPVGKRLASVQFNNLEPRGNEELHSLMLNAVRHVYAWTQRLHSSLVLGGAAGTCKTTVAYPAYKYLRYWLGIPAV